jgi:hypothetical protein
MLQFTQCLYDLKSEIAAAKVELQEFEQQFRLLKQFGDIAKIKEATGIINALSNKVAELQQFYTNFQNGYEIFKQLELQICNGNRSNPELKAAYIEQEKQLLFSIPKRYSYCPNLNQFG